MAILDDLVSRGLVISERIKEEFEWGQVEDYVGFLHAENERGGFFSRGDADRILDRHVYENLVFVDYVASKCSVSRETSVADAGTGPGLPGFLFACLKNRPRVALIDSSRRRLSLLEDYRASREPRSEGRVDFIYGRIEDLRLQFDVVVARALIPFPYNAELCSRLVRLGGFLALSGSRFSDARVSHLGFVSRETYVPSELSFLGARSFLLLQKTTKQDSRYPRPWKTIQQEMKQWKESTL